MISYLDGPGFSARLFLRSGTKLVELFEFSLELAEFDVSLGLTTLAGTVIGGFCFSTTTPVAPA